jgi:hypothetical protein
LRHLRTANGAWASVRDETSPGAAVLRGRASPAVVAWLAVALLESRQPAQREAGRSLAETLAASATQPSTAADGLAVAMALSRAGETALSETLAARMHARFFSPDLGHYLSPGAENLPGVPLRVPAPAEPLSAEVIALQLDAGDPPARQALRNALRWRVEYEPLPAGEILHALAGRP